MVNILSSGFLASLATIVVIDLVLAGDNAIVIALAVRNVPANLQRRAIAWGTLGAIGMRVSMTMIVVWLLAIPGLMLVGGALLIGIAYRLLEPKEEQGGAGHVKAADNFWGALRMIVVADALMGLDNVLAVAGAAHGSFVLVVLGLLISIPIVIWGSTLLLRFVERYPMFVYVGSAVLAGTAVRMMTGEPLARPLLNEAPVIVPLLYVAVIAGVLGAGALRHHRRLESRITARVVQLGARTSGRGDGPPARQGESMQKILVPVNASTNSRHAIRHVIAEFGRNPHMEVHLLNVQPPFSRHVTQFLAKKDLQAFHREQAQNVLAPARELLDATGVPYTSHCEVGHKADVIVAMARKLRCDHIVMSTARKNSLTRMLEASVTNRVLERTTVPVEVIAGDAVSKVERYGIPAAIAAGLGMLAFAID